MEYGRQHGECAPSAICLLCRRSRHAGECPWEGSRSHVLAASRALHQAGMHEENVQSRAKGRLPAGRVYTAGRCVPEEVPRTAGAARACRRGYAQHAARRAIHRALCRLPAQSRDCLRRQTRSGMLLMSFKSSPGSNRRYEYVCSLLPARRVMKAARA